MRKPIDILISEECVSRSIYRALEQEAVYGHNTGHFTLEVEKENTTIGVIGEELVREFFQTAFKNLKLDGELNLTPFGSQFDLEISLKKGAETTKRFLHVKTGLWKKWPSPAYAFGIHADQKIQSLGAPLILVSLLKNDGAWPARGRIEGYLSSAELAALPQINKGEKFPVTGVISRTDNLLSFIDQYKPIEELLEWVEKIQK